MKIFQPCPLKVNNSACPSLRVTTQGTPTFPNALQEMLQDKNHCSRSMCDMLQALNKNRWGRSDRMRQAFRFFFLNFEWNYENSYTGKEVWALWFCSALVLPLGCKIGFFLVLYEREVKKVWFTLSICCQVAKVHIALLFSVYVHSLKKNNWNGFKNQTKHLHPVISTSNGFSFTPL